MKTYQIHLIRHGIIDGNLKGQYIGVTDQPLAPEGVRQLLELKERYQYPQAQRYFCSPLLRCKQTMKVLYPEADPTLVPGFSECSFGVFEGKSAQELEQDPRFIQWMEEGGTGAPPEGESGVDFQIRCCNAFIELVQGLMKTGTTSAVVVAHGGTIMSILAAFGLPRANFFDWMCQNGHGYSLRVTPSLWMSGQVVEAYQMLPLGYGPQRTDEQKIILDVAREAADRAYGRPEEPKYEAPERKGDEP